mmetsp:Transcript_21377/g.38294  ORF Transcript_21377/g.38294 Transcript_21377/m.38294 type:complete len:135 (-) Transcript_21377:84-488(-)
MGNFMRRKLDPSPKTILLFINTTDVAQSSTMSHRVRSSGAQQMKTSCKKIYPTTVLDTKTTVTNLTAFFKEGDRTTHFVHCSPPPPISSAGYLSNIALPIVGVVSTTDVSATVGCNQHSVPDASKRSSRVVVKY